MLPGADQSLIARCRLIGGSAALNEMHLMIGEKVNAAFETGANLMAGASADSVVDRYRQLMSLPTPEQLSNR
jgi:hypothetical protein